MTRLGAEVRVSHVQIRVPARAASWGQDRAKASVAFLTPQAGPVAGDEEEGPSLYPLVARARAHHHDLHEEEEEEEEEV